MMRGSSATRASLVIDALTLCVIVWLCLVDSRYAAATRELAARFLELTKVTVQQTEEIKALCRELNCDGVGEVEPGPWRDEP